MINTKIALEDEISRIIMSDNGCTAHYEYKSCVTTKSIDSPELKQVTVMTYNIHSKATFLLKEVIAPTIEDGLKEILKYVKSHKEDYDSFTIVWAKKGTVKSTEKSYFYCKDLFEALEKFYFNKNREEYVIYEAKMNARA